MNVKTLLSLQGINITKGMAPIAFITNIVKSPVVNKFVPQLQTLSNNIGSVLDGYNKIKNTIQTTKNRLESAEKKLRQLEKALDAYRLVFQGNLQNAGAYIAPSTGGPCSPAPALKPQYALIAQAQTFVDTQIDTVIPQIKEQIATLEDNLKKYEDAMNKQVSKYIDYIISADLFNLPSFDFGENTLVQTANKYTETALQDAALDVSNLTDIIKTI